MWYVSQCTTDSIIVLDEPDVYMHADLQRRLVRLLMPKFTQVIIATHSLEIIEEVSSDCIVPIDSTKLELRPIGNENILHGVTSELKGSMNIDLARMYVSKSFIIWDSDETSRKMLSAFQSILYPEDIYPIINLPKAFINRCDDWSTVISLSEIFKSSKMPVNIPWESFTYEEEK
jgi:energy-coupling factor transporter ATP-binding protein EcfA2